MKHAIALGLSALLALTACGNDTEKASNGEIFRALTSGATSKMKGQSAAPTPIARALVSQALAPVLLATLDKTGQQALLAEIRSSGGVETWSSVDDVTISLRNGVVVATRGLGADLMAASVPSVTRNSTGSHTRVHTLLNGEDQAVQTQFICTFRNAGTQTITVVELSYATTQITESCSADGQSFENQYWVSGSGLIRKSLQWLSPDLGYITVEDLKP